MSRDTGPQATAVEFSDGHVMPRSGAPAAHSGRYGASSIPDRHHEDDPSAVASGGRLVHLDGNGQREAGVVVVEHTVGKVLLSLSQEKGHAGSEGCRTRAPKRGPASTA